MQEYVSTDSMFNFMGGCNDRSSEAPCSLVHVLLPLWHSNVVTQRVAVTTPHHATLRGIAPQLFVQSNSLRPLNQIPYCTWCDRLAVCHTINDIV